MKNVLFLSSWFPSRVHTTLGNFVKYHAHSSAKFNNIFVLYIVADDSIKNYELVTSNENNLVITTVYFKRGFFKYFNYFKAFLIGFNFYTKSKALHFDVVHMNIIHPGIWQALYLKIRYQIPYIVSENWHGFQDLSKYKLSFLQRFFINYGFKKSSFICPVSIQLKNCMIKAGFSANYKVIPNVVNTNIFNISKVQKSKSFTFLHISTLDDSIKNISGIIEAFDQLKIPNCTLKIIGDGPLEWITKKINILPSRNSIVLKGEMAHSDIAKEMQLANVFVLFSNIENLPLVLIECMASGIPFISSNVGGISELYNKEVGVLVDPGDIKNLYKQMELMFQNYNNYIPEKIRKHALDNYSEKVVGKQFNDLYIEL